MKLGKNKLLLIIIIAIIVISGIIYFLNSNVLPSPQKTVKDYFNYIINEDYSKAYELLTGNFKQSKGTLEEFTALFENARAHGTVYVGVKINSVTNTNRKSQKIVSFSLKVKEKGRETTSFGQYLVIKEADNIWRISDSLQ
ncbi:MAG: hypothetical protein PHQ76_00980 [Caldisericia bacterium]|nr:hypothetical protein [Caldisericia bacterium]MDD5688836.1 hypothetical protein [Caldisericia bacterium]HOW02561.1 hypothetical protein [Caldisericia bacterium]